MRFLLCCAAAALQAVARGRKVRKRFSEVRAAAKYNLEDEFEDDFDFDEVSPEIPGAPYAFSASLRCVVFYCFCLS